MALSIKFKIMTILIILKMKLWIVNTGTVQKYNTVILSVFDNITREWSLLGGGGGGRVISSEQSLIGFKH